MFGGELDLVGGELDLVGGEPDLVGGELDLVGGELDLVGGELDLVGGELDQVQSKWGRTRWGRTRHGAKTGINPNFRGGAGLLSESYGIAKDVLIRQWIKAQGIIDMRARANEPW